MKHHCKIKHIFDPLFKQNIYYIGVKTNKEYLKILKKEYNLEGKTDVAGRFQVIDKQGQKIGLIWAPKDNIPCIVHECMHAVNWYLGKRGIYLSFDAEGFDNGEIFAYCIEFLVKEILSNRYDNRIKIRRIK